MESSRNFDRIDILKLIVFLILVFVLIGMWIVSATKPESPQAGETPVVTSAPVEATQTVLGGEVEPEATAAQTEPAAPTEPPVIATQTIPEGLPALPAGSEGLNFNPGDGRFYTPDGRAVYILDAENMTWIPLLPEDLAGELGNPTPVQDSSGAWVVVSADGKAQYQWDEATLTWVQVEVAYIPSVGAGEQTPAAPTEETPASTPETPTPEAPGEAPVAAGEGTPVQPVEVPSDLLRVPRVYTLHTGEFPFCLARRFDVNPGDLLVMNGLMQDMYVYAGMKLGIPKNDRPFPLDRSLLDHPATYTVQDGDTIYTIACKYGDVFPKAIAYANQLTAPYALTAGQSLYIP